MINKKCSQFNYAKTDLNSLFIVDSANHLHTYLRDAIEVRLLQTNVAEYFDDALTHTDAGVLNTQLYYSHSRNPYQHITQLQVLLNSKEI